jgi:hypothetical protein
MAFGQEDGSGLSRKWAALRDGADAIAALAGVTAEPDTDIRDFPRLIRKAAPWRRELAARGIDDIVQIMQLGLTALLGAEARGVDSAAAGLALWREFVEARAAVLALLPPSDAQGPLLGD